ncbi:MAG: transglycosylase SLT domain-containing protein [Candidatus Thiodiazotropha endolucinida]
MHNLNGIRFEPVSPQSKSSGLALVRTAILPCLMAVYGCSSSPPRNMADACDIFEEKDDWYEASEEAFEKWGVPIHVQLAIIHQESRFEHDAKPPREKLFWFIPWFRKSSAYGYAQVQDTTWEWYQRETGNSWADRDDYEDAVDFIGWYGSVSHRKLGISKWDTYRQYLAYHEGHGGYKRASYNKKPWLLKVARKVESNAKRYRSQIASCRERLERGWSLWPF